MKIAAGILTHNMLSTGRQDLFRQTVKSLLMERPDYLFILDNGSTDDTGEYVAALGGTVLRDPISTCGHGMNVTISACANSGADVVVFSNDDIAWRPGWRDVLERFWAAAPADVLIASGQLEDEFPWNTVRESIEVGGVRALVRDSAPGGTWTLRAQDWNLIGPVPEAPGYDDVPACERLRAMGFRVAQLDIAEHRGGRISTWGNGAASYGKQLDREAWGV